MASSDLYDLTIASHLIVETFLISQGYASTAAQLRADASTAGLSLPALPNIVDSSLDLRHLVDSYRSGVRAEERKRKAEQLHATHATRSIADPLTLTLPGSPTLPFKLDKTHSTLHAANILSIAKLKLPRRQFDTSTADYVNSVQECLVTTAADKRIVFSNKDTGDVEEILESNYGHQAAVLSVAQDPQDPRCLISSGMDSRIVVWDLLTRKPIQVLKEHSKFVVKVAVSPTGEFLASIGYDKKLIVYRRKHSTAFDASSQDAQDGAELEQVDELKGGRYEKVWEMETQNNPEAILFIRAGLAPEAPDDEASAAAAATEATGSGTAGEVVVLEARQKRTWLCFTVRNDSFIHYVALPTAADASVDSLVSQLSSTHLGQAGVEPAKQSAPLAAAGDWSLHSFNTNPNPLDLHVSYSLLSLSLHPSSLYICVQTGDHTSPALASSSSSASLPGSLSRLLLLPPLSSTRAATIWTGVATSSYAVPRHSWLPSGRGVWLNAEDGVLRLVDLKGRTRATVLAHGLAAAAGEREAAATWTRGGGNTIVKDVVVTSESQLASCGFDKTVRIISIDHGIL